MRHEVADAAPRLGKADLAQDLHRPPDRIAADLVPLAQLWLGGQGRAGRQLPDDDRATQVDRQLQVGGQHAARIDDGDIDDVADTVHRPLVLSREVTLITLLHLYLPLARVPRYILPILVWTTLQADRRTSRGYTSSPQLSGTAGAFIQLSHPKEGGPDRSREAPSASLPSGRCPSCSPTGSTRGGSTACRRAGAQRGRAPARSARPLLTLDAGRKGRRSA